MNTTFQMNDEASHAPNLNGSYSNYNHLSSFNNTAPDSISGNPSAFQNGTNSVQNGQYPNQTINTSQNFENAIIKENNVSYSPVKKVQPGKPAIPHKSSKMTPKKQGVEDNTFSIQQWRQWKGKYSAKDSNGFHCLVCPGKSYSTERALLRHYKQVHELICAQCKICFSEEQLLKQHRKENHEFWCFPCSKVYTTSRALRRHNQQQHGISLSRSISKSQLEMTGDNKSVGHGENTEVIS